MTDTPPRVKADLSFQVRVMIPAYAKDQEDADIVLKFPFPVRLETVAAEASEVVLLINMSSTGETLAAFKHWGYAALIDL